MKLSYSAAFSGFSIVSALAFSFFFARPGLRMVGVQLPRQVWLSEQGHLWQLNWWLWLLFIFSWMCLLATFIWRYTPVHRVPTMLQTGLMIISAILAMSGILVWMNLLPLSATYNDPNMVTLVDTMAMGFIGAGCFMTGAVTTWICIDLLWLKKLQWSWVLPGILSGAALIPTPFLLPNTSNLLLASLFWIIWCLWLLTRGPEPKPFPELL